MTSIRIEVPNGPGLVIGGTLGANYRTRIYTKRDGVWRSDQNVRVTTQEFADALDALYSTGKFTIPDRRVYIKLGETSWEHRMTPWGTTVWVKERPMYPSQICAFEEAPDDMQKALSCIARERGWIL